MDIGKFPSQMSRWSYSVVVITLVSDAGDLGSIPSKTFFFILNFL